MDNKIKEIENALIEVRKAQRLLYSYQERMVNIAKVIMSKLGTGKELVGNRLQFDEFRNISGSDRSNIRFDINWTWDFFYGYAFEYYMHSSEVKINGKSVSLFASLVQITDTGHYKKLDMLDDGIDRTKNICSVEEYLDVDKCSTDLILSLELVEGKESSFWRTKTRKNRKTKMEYILGLYGLKTKYSGRIHPRFHSTDSFHSSQLVMRKYSASEFHSNEAIDEILNDVLGDYKEIILA